MDKIHAQQKIASAIQRDAEAVIAQAILFDPSVRETIADVRAVPGPIQGVAAIALKHALRGSTNEETVAKMIQFAALICID